MPGIEAAVREIQPDVLVIDSIQTVWDPDIDSAPGLGGPGPGCAHQLAAMAKAGGPATILVGHVTKEGALAGPRVLEHLVDTVLSFEGDRHHALRLLRSVKHRFGPDRGARPVRDDRAGARGGVADPGGLFLVDRRVGSPGSVVFPSMEGQRPLLVEIQALVVPSPMVEPAPFGDRDSTPAGWRCCWPSSTGGPGCASAATTCTSRPSAGSASPTRAPTWPCAWPWRRRPRVYPSATTWWCWARSAWPARSARCRRPPGAWRKRPGSASRGPWCPIRRPDGRRWTCRCRTVSGSPTLSRTRPGRAGRRAAAAPSQPPEPRRRARRQVAGAEPRRGYAAARTASAARRPRGCRCR